MPKAQIAGQGNSLSEAEKQHRESRDWAPVLSPNPASVLGQAWGFPICQTNRKDSCPLPKAGAHLPTLSPSCLLPRQSVTTTSARKAREAHWAYSPACLTLLTSQASAWTTHREVCENGHAGPQAWRTVHTHADMHMHTDITQPLGHSSVPHIPSMLRHTSCTVHTPHSTWATYPHMHRWLLMMLTHCRKICRDLPASPVTARWWDSPTGLPFDALIN